MICGSWFLAFASLLCHHEGLTSSLYFPELILLKKLCINFSIVVNIQYYSVLVSDVQQRLILKFSLLSAWPILIKALPFLFKDKCLCTHKFLWQVLPCLLSWSPCYSDLTWTPVPSKSWKPALPFQDPFPWTYLGFPSGNHFFGSPSHIPFWWKVHSCHICCFPLDFQPSTAFFLN